MPEIMRQSVYLEPWLLRHNMLLFLKTFESWFCFCWCRIYYDFLNGYFCNWRINIMGPRHYVCMYVCIQALVEQKDELFLLIASVCAALSVCSLTNISWQQSPSDKSLFSGCLRLSAYYGSWQFRTKLFTVKRNLPQACSCVNGEKMTGTLTASAVEQLQDVARKKKWGSSSFPVLINLQRQEYVTTVKNSCYTACNESLDIPRWQGFQTEHMIIKVDVLKKPPKNNTNNNTIN